jgi:hypothetical protein
MKKSLLALSVTLFLTGCASFNNMGTTTANVNPVMNSKGNQTGCSFEYRDGKESSQKIVSFDGQRCTLDIGTANEKAFKAHALGVKALNILPTFGLDDILKGGAD